MNSYMYVGMTMVKKKNSDKMIISVHKASSHMTNLH